MNQKYYSVKYRWLTFLLCLALCMESSPMQAYAAGMGNAASEAEAGGIMMEDGSDHDQEDADRAEISVEDGFVDDAADDTALDVGSGNGTADTENAVDGTENPADGTGNAADGTGDVTDGTEDPAEDTEDSSHTDSPAVSGNDSDSVSGNDTPSVSENDLQSVSENTLEEALGSRIDAAEEAFRNLLAGKDLMALLYHTDTYSARREPEEQSIGTATLETGQTLYIRGIRITEEDIWYETQFFINGAEGTGYVQSYYLAYADEDWLAWEKEYLLPILESGEAYGFSAYGMSSYSRMPYAIDTSDITAFPGSYQSALRSLKNAHPNWTFVPMKTGLDFNTAVSSEMGDRSLIQNLTSNASKGWVGDPCPSESGWYYATKPAVAYHMDPRNFLTETYIFQFEQLTFNSSYHTQSAVQTFLNGTFMKGVLADDAAGRTYAQAFYEIGKNRKLSPIHLASRVYQEQGQGNSGLISGTYPGYEKYYNFFNVGVNGSSTEEKIVKGLAYAKKQGWDTRYKSLEGGAATIGNNYILKYQDTIYLEKFNVDRNSPYGVYNHQYMQNIQAPASESSSTRKMYNNAGSLNSAFVFKIPVYDNMPEEIYYPTLTLNKSSMTLDRSDEKDCRDGQQLKLYIDDVEVQPAEAVWSSSDPSVVTVTEGLVKIAGGENGKAGEAVVTAAYQVAGTSDTVEVSCKVKVVISLQGISMNETEMTLRRSDTVVQDTTGLSEAEKAENRAEASLQITFAPEDTTSDKTITWTSSNTKVVKVVSDPASTADAPKAIVTAVGKGEAKITAKASRAGSPVKTATCTVTVKAPIYQLAVTNPNVEATDMPDRTTLLAGQSVNLAAEYWPKDTTSDTQVSWSSSDEKVARVTNGRVEALSRGTAMITARSAGCEQGYTARHTVVVEECTVIFRKADGSGVLKQQTVLYGTRLSAEAFPAAEEMPDSLFIGWYTGENGTGKQFDETKAVYQQETVLYPWYEEQGKGFYVLPVGDQTYTGSAVKPAVHVYDSVSGQDGSRELIELTLNKDYTVSYKNNKNVNTEGKAVPQITVKGKGNYSGTESVNFNIVPKALTDTDITVADITVAYSGKTIKSSPVVSRDGRTLKKNTDYTVSYPQTGTGAYQTAGTYPVRITGKGGYTGTITVYETITQKVLMSKTTIAKIPNQTYRNDLVDKENGIGIVPSEPLKVTYKVKELVQSTDGGLTGDYTVSWQNHTAVGTATATVTAVEGSGYAGSKSVSYKIVGTSIAKVKVEGLENKEYTGREKDAEQIPGSYRLMLDGRELAESTDGGLTGDYLVSYSNLTRAGTAKILFTGVNEYTGKVTKTYKITKCRLDSDESGMNSDLTLQYYTQDAPDRRRQITDLSQITTPYMKGGSKPGIVLTFHGAELIQGKDYTVKYSNNNMLAASSDPEAQAGSKLPKITVTGKGNFQGTITGFFEITDGQMAQDNGKLTMTARDVVYKNRKNAWKGTVTLTDCNGAKLSAGKDYDRNLAYTYAEDAYVCAENDGSAGNNGGTGNTGNTMETGEYDESVILRKAGSAVEENDIPTAGTAIRVTARGLGFYAGSGDAAISTVYRIVKADISKAKVKVRAKEYQNGHPVTLTEEDLTITASGSPEPLQCGVDYTIDESTYAKNQNKGKATVTIRGLGNYGGEKKVTYTIGAKALVWWKNLLWK